MGGTSVPTLLCQSAAIRAKSVGTEVPPTRTKRSARPGRGPCRKRKKARRCRAFSLRHAVRGAYLRLPAGGSINSACPGLSTAPAARPLSLSRSAARTP
ncbi:DUF6053 domain-containing protein [Lysobacter enzymogenes]|uniref:DUF6053 domain-containing protein n=1 Tax=Lysobacter enzymogenes TaxID=69 RepID=UPI003D2F80F6